MKVLLLGGTGRTGRHVLAALLENGYQVRAIVRDIKGINILSPNLLLIEGDTRNASSLRPLLDGCDAAISTLNISRTSDFPWSALRTPPTFLSDSMRALLEAAYQCGTKKIIVCSAWGVLETKKQLPAWFRWLIKHSNIGEAYRDHERQERLLEQSSLDYTIVRPVALTNSTRPEQLGTSSKMPESLFISRLSVASFIVSLLTDDQYSRQAITISRK